MAVMSGWFRGVVRNDEPTQPVTVYERDFQDYANDVMAAKQRIVDHMQQGEYLQAQFRGAQQALVTFCEDKGLPFRLEPLPFDGKPYKFED